MRGSRFAVVLAVVLLLAPAARATEPLVVGEHVAERFETPHPYASSGGTSPALTWSDRIDFPGATYIAPHFSRFELAPGDFVVRRQDGSAAYQLAVVVDDAAMAVDEVVRGDDLVPSTFRQILLFRALQCESPVFGHAPLLLGPDGIRLSKRHEGTSIREVRSAGWSAERVIGLLASLLGIRSEAVPVAAADLVDGFSLARIRKTAAGIRIPEL